MGGWYVRVIIEARQPHQNSRLFRCRKYAYRIASTTIAVMSDKSITRKGGAPLNP